MAAPPAAPAAPTGASLAAPFPPEAPAAPPANVPATTQASTEDVYGMSFREAWRYGGSIMYVLAVLSVIGLALVVYLLVLLRPSVITPRALRLELSDKLRAGDDAAARRACESRPCPLAAVAMAGLNALRNSSRLDRDLLKDAMETEGARQAQSLEGTVHWLLDISVVAPMLGLLGTVLGMLKAFGSIAHDVAAAKPVILAEGVSQAIVTTVFGLIVAIPALCFHSWLRRRAARQISILEAAAAELLSDLLAREEP
jgi:biopolymer transport protein ExbB